MGQRAARTQAITLGEAAEETPEVEVEPSLSLFDASGDARVRVLRRDDKTQKWVPHGYFPPDATEETILTEFGGGRYWVQLLAPVDGKEAIRNHRKFELKGAYKEPRGDLPGIGSRAAGASDNAPVAATILPSGQQQPFTGGDDLMQVLKAGIINTLLEMMKSTKEMSANRAPAVDPMMMELMKAQASTQQQMMQFMLTLATKDNGGDSKKDMLDLMAKMKELVTPAGTSSPLPTDPMAMFTSMLDVFKSFREAAEDVAPPQGGDPLMNSLPGLVKVISEQHELQKDRATPHAPPPQGQPIVGTIQPPQQPGQPVAMWQRALREHAKRLVASAAAKHDPNVIAGTAILFAPPALLEAFQLFFHREEEEVLADVLTEIPALAEHREWALDFIGAAQERLFPDEYTDDAEEVIEAAVS